MVVVARTHTRTHAVRKGEDHKKTDGQREIFYRVTISFDRNTKISIIKTYLCISFSLTTN